MSGPRFLGLDASFGRHEGSWSLESDGPVLIAGPNGSGKTTLLDALLRTVFGFQRKSKSDRELYDARRPWNARLFRSTVRLSRADGTVLDWSRDFDTDEATIRMAGGDILFDGTANPGSGGSADRRYREIVHEVFGVADLDSYGRTSWIGQGDVLQTRFDGDLLRLADGGHAQLLRALEAIATRHRGMTREPVSDDGRRLPRERPLEQEERALGRACAELAEAEAALRARGPDTERSDAVEAEISDLGITIARLEAIHTHLIEERRLAAEHADAAGRLDRLVELREELRGAARDVADLERECELLGRAADGPADLPGRLAELRAAWNEETRLEAAVRAAAVDVGATTPRGRDRFALGTVFLAALGAVAAAFFAGAAFAWLGVAATAGFGAWLAVGMAERRGLNRGAVRRHEDELRRLAELVDRIAALREGIPDGDSLDPSNAAERLERHERASAAQRDRELARGRHRDAARRIRGLAEAEAAPGRSLPLLVADAQRRLSDIESAQRDLADSAPRSGDAHPYPSPRTVAEDVAENRRRLEGLRTERDRLIVRLDRSRRAAADVNRLDREVFELTARVGDLERSVQAHRAAHALLRDGYREFREHDEARLIAAVSARLRHLADPIGSFRAEDGLDKPTVELDGRRVAFDSPHLSHGQRHLVMLAIRLGASDFLAAAGLAVPILIDEPFAHLDDRHAREVWVLLEQVAADRQVIVTSQDIGRLERLEVKPTIRLAARQMSKGRPAVRPDIETGPAGAPYGSTPGQADVFDYETSRTGAGHGGETSGDPEGGSES